MQEAVGNLQSTIFSLITYLLIAGIVGYIAVPVFLKEFGVNKQTRQAISQLIVVILFFVVFIFKFKTL